MIAENDKLFEFQHRIDDRCFDGSCEINFKIHENVKGTVYFYVKYRDFYINHRKVVNSVDYT